MALRPAELQVVLSATRDTERVQHLQQQRSSLQQEQLALQFQKEIEERKRQTQSIVRAEETMIKKIEKEKERNTNVFLGQKRISLKKERDLEEVIFADSQHIIDLLI